MKNIVCLKLSIIIRNLLFSAYLNSSFLFITKTKKVLFFIYILSCKTNKKDLKYFIGKKNK